MHLRPLRRQAPIEQITRLARYSRAEQLFVPPNTFMLNHYCSFGPRCTSITLIHYVRVKQNNYSLGTNVRTEPLFITSAGGEWLCDLVNKLKKNPRLHFSSPLHKQIVSGSKYVRFQFVIVLITIFSNSYKQMLVRGKVQSIHVRECITPEASLRCQAKHICKESSYRSMVSRMLCRPLFLHRR